ncbi:hypothetical protein B0J11DRAFT_598219 [Dendryphion nanum]|uniref:Polycomb protein VEFS-Box domain-containing protein n=1 Tax=Dendryphion nanum TaxID=256645 RepID=A0A9P9IA70_9PLEO|nr:hypothetical protein B0J11DRAFT_598219 [Dendryphion nanum]
MTDGARLPAGNILLYDYIRRKRNPTFLNRNLYQALKRHEQELSPEAPGELERYSQRHWKPPTLAMIRERETKKALLLKVRGVESSSDDGLEERLGNLSNHENRNLLFKCEVRIRIDVWNPETAKSCIRKEIDGYIYGVDLETKKAIKIELPDDFTIPLQDLKVPTDSHNPQSLNKSAMPAYQLRISLILEYQLDAQTVLSYTPIRNPSLLSNPPLRFFTNLTDIKALTKNSHILPLTYEYNTQHKHLHLGLWINIGWITPTKSSVIADANLSRRKQRIITFPMAVKSGRKRGYLITYNYSNKSTSYRGIRCCHCIKHSINMSFLRITDLQFHLDSFHSLFKHDFQKVDGPEGTPNNWIVDVILAENKVAQRASDRAPDPRDVQIVAPQRPFNQREYLEHGDDSWQKEARGERIPTSGTLVVQKSFSARRKDPCEVQTKRAVEKKRYRVPKAPDSIRFYRSLTKRPLMEGEEISESEDDIDIDWIRLKTDALILNDPSIREPAKRFLQVWNVYIREERLQDNVHMGDALIRFAQEMARWLETNDLVGEFRERVETLVKDRIISVKVSEACLDIVNQAHLETASDLNHQKETKMFARTTRKLLVRLPLPSRMDGQSDKDQAVAGATNTKINLSRTSKSVDLGGDTVMRDTEMDQSPTKKPIPIDEYDKCICGHGVPIHDKRPIIFCENNVRLNFTSMNVFVTISISIASWSGGNLLGYRIN